MLFKITWVDTNRPVAGSTLPLPVQLWGFSNQNPYSSQSAWFWSTAAQREWMALLNFCQWKFISKVFCSTALLEFEFFYRRVNVDITLVKTAWYRFEWTLSCHCDLSQQKTRTLTNFLMCNYYYLFPFWVSCKIMNPWRELLCLFLYNYIEYPTHVFRILTSWAQQMWSVIRMSTLNPNSFVEKHLSYNA